MASPSDTFSPRGSRASTPILVEADFETQDFDEMLFLTQTDRSCMPYSVSADQLVLAPSEAATILLMCETGQYANARKAIDAVFERQGIPPHAVAHMVDTAAKEQELYGLPPYSPAWMPDHNTVVVSDDATLDQTVPPQYALSRFDTPSLCSDAEASSASSSSGLATPADIFMKRLHDEVIEEEERERVAEVVSDATLVAGPSSSRKRSRTVSSVDDDLDFEPHVVSKPQPRKRARVARRAVVDSDADSSDSEEEDRPARKQKSNKRARGAAKPVNCRCGHDKCRGDAGFSSIRVYERHYRSVHLGQASDLQCGGCGLTFESGRKDSVLRHQGKNNQRQCIGKPILVANADRRVQIPRPIML